MQPEVLHIEFEEGIRVLRENKLHAKGLEGSRRSSLNAVSDLAG
jgi:hypothetical protein